MWAFLRKARSDDQPAETFSTIAAVHGWLTAQSAACNTADFQKLRGAVTVLRSMPSPRQEQVLPLCSAWDVRQKDGRWRRPLQTLIKELHQAVITEGNRLRASHDGQTGASACSAEQPAARAEVASSAAQPAVAGRTGKRPLDSVSAAQPAIPTKRQRDNSIVNILRGHPPNSDSSIGAAQPGPPTKQQRLTGSTAQPGAAATAATTAAAVPPPPLPPREIDNGAADQIDNGTPRENMQRRPRGHPE